MFIAVVVGQEGCDYAIGCGVKVIQLESLTQILAIAELREIVIGSPWIDGERSGYEGSYWYNGHRLTEIALYEVSSHLSVPVGQWYADAEEALKQMGVDALKDLEYEEYLRLKSKFGP